MDGNCAWVRGAACLYLYRCAPCSHFSDGCAHVGLAGADAEIQCQLSEPLRKGEEANKKMLCHMIRIRSSTMLWHNPTAPAGEVLRSIGDRGARGIPVDFSGVPYWQFLVQTGFCCATHAFACQELWLPSLPTITDGVSVSSTPPERPRTRRLMLRV